MEPTLKSPIWRSFNSDRIQPQAEKKHNPYQRSDTVRIMPSVMLLQGGSWLHKITRARIWRDPASRIDIE